MAKLFLYFGAIMQILIFLINRMDYVNAITQKDNMKTVTEIFKAFGEFNLEKVLTYISPSATVSTVASAQTTPAFATYKGEYLKYLITFGTVFQTKSLNIISMTSNENQVSAILDAEIFQPNTGKFIGLSKQNILFSFDKKGKVTNTLLFLDTAAFNDILVEGQTPYSNLALITANIAHFNTRNVDLAFGDYTSNAFFKAGLGPAVDVAIVKAFFKDFFESFPDCTFELLSLVGDSNSVTQTLVISGTFSGKPFAGMQPTNKKFKSFDIAISTIKDGKIISEQNAINLVDDVFAQVSPA